MQDIKEFNLKELESLFKKWQAQSFHARQVFLWIYRQGAGDFSQMSNLPLELRKKLAANFYIFGSEIKNKLRSTDGTEKSLFELRDGNFIEAVSIPAKSRVTACVSSQAGCKFSCDFCASGLSGFKRNLSSAEIIEQPLCLKNEEPERKLTHIVFMGTGEPLDNYDNVLKAVRIINSDYSFNIAARRVTISTCGIVPGIKRLAEENLQIELSVSLHAADDLTRDKIMPVNRKYPLKELISACQEYIDKTNRQITFEYILIKDVNSDLQNAKRLCKLLKGLRLYKVNLIPANTIGQLNIQPPERKEILLFRDFLLRQAVVTTLRKSRGQDIEAACGQLRLKYVKK